MSVKKSLNLVMQSKGGAGKSVCALMLAQYFIERFGTDAVNLVDTDPNNKTLAAFEGLKVKEVNIVENIGVEAVIDASKFDSFINDFVEEDKAMVVDTGSGEYLAITSYLKSNEIVSNLLDMDRNIYIHCPVNFGQSSQETLQCLGMLAEAFNDAKIIVWENEFFGKSDEEFDYQKSVPNILGVVKIEKRSADTFEKDFANMLKNHLTFEQVRNSDDFGFMQKNRIEKQKKAIFEQLDALL